MVHSFLANFVILHLTFWMDAAADPGFPDGVYHPKGEGYQPIIWPNFLEDCMKVKKIWPSGGSRPNFFYINPPLD